MFNQKLIKGLYLKIYQYGMSFMDLFMQSLAMNWACDIELPECLAETLNSMNSLMSSDFHIPANDHQKILCNGLKFGNDNDFEVLWRNLQSSKNLEERLNLIDALACYPKSQALKDYLESTLVNSVEAQYSRKECLEVIKAVISRSSLGFKVSLDFLMEFKEFNISRRYGQEINGIFEEISKKVKTSEVLLEVMQNILIMHVLIFLF